MNNSYSVLFVSSISLLSAERRLKREIDQIVADFRRDWQWPQGPLEEPQRPTVGESRLKLVGSQPA